MTDFNPDAYLSEKGDSFNPDAYLASKGKVGDEPSALDKFGRWAGLETRNLIQGATALPATLLMDPISALYNFGADKIQGNGNGPRFNEANANIANMLTNMGLPNPETPGERVGSAIAQGVVGAGQGIYGLGRGLQSAASPTAQAMGRTLSANPIKQVIGGATGGGSAAVAKEAGLPIPLQIAAGVAGGITPFAAPSVATGLSRVANRGLSALSNGEIQLLNPATEAERRLRQAFTSDGGPQAAGQLAGSFADSGASTPSLLDIGGASVRRLVRASAGGGDEAHNLATGYADRIRADLQDNATNAVERMAPGGMSAGRTEAALTQGQRDLANTLYAQPYSEPATVTRGMVDALQGPTGRSAIRRALNTAEIRRDHQQMGELQDLLTVADAQSGGTDPITGRFQSLPDALEGLSAGALDRVRIAMRETGNAVAMRGNNSAAGGYFGRVNDIDTALDQTAGLVPARAAYRQTQQGIEAVPHGQAILQMPANQYAEESARLASVGGPPNIGTGLRAGAKDSIIAGIQSPAAGQTGILNRLASSTGLGRNLSNTFGEDRASTFQQALGNELRRVKNANFISPETGSQTQLRAADQGLLGGVPTSVSSFVSKVADKFLRGVSLTPAERAEVVRLGISEADLTRFASTPTVTRANPAANAVQLGGILAGRNQ